jgi:hypothetical protein
MCTASTTRSSTGGVRDTPQVDGGKNHHTGNTHVADVLNHECHESTRIRVIAGLIRRGFLQHWGKRADHGSTRGCKSRDRRPAWRPIPAMRIPPYCCQTPVCSSDGRDLAWNGATRFPWEIWKPRDSARESEPESARRIRRPGPHGCKQVNPLPANLRREQRRRKCDPRTWQKSSA